jgi:sigma-B regulation protein RsbU (phosphoserine phosphatase)
MRDTGSSYQAVQRRANVALIAVNVLGALVTFLYFNIIAPLPQDQAPLRTVDWIDVVFVVLLLGLPLTAGFLWDRRRNDQIGEWYQRLRDGAPAADVPDQVRRSVLNLPPLSAVMNGSAWLLVGLVASLAARTFRNLLVFVGLGGLLTTAMFYFVVDLIWRPMIPVFFPDGKLSAVRAIRLPVLGRLLVVLLGVGILPPALLISLSSQRAQALLTAPNPQAVLDNLLILQIFIVATSIAASVGLAVFTTRGITGPLARLQQAMSRVEQNDFDVRVPVFSNDELGYLSEGLNEMAAGLQERELLKEAHSQVEQELAVAWRIQESFLPDHVPQVPGWQLAASLQPARQTSGDFYDFIPLPGGCLGFLVADVADKGTPAALYMALSRTLIRTYAVEYEAQPARVLRAANRRILRDTQADLFVTVFYGVLDPATGSLTYCNAGHNPPYLLSAENGGAVQALSLTGMALGVLEEAEWEEAAAQMAEGDVLALYSDGITDAQNAQEALFGAERLQAVLQANRQRSAQEVQDALLAEVRAFVGDAPQFDDMTLMIVVRGSTGM